MQNTATSADGPSQHSTLPNKPEQVNEEPRRKGVGQPYILVVLGLPAWTPAVEMSMSLHCHRGNVHTISSDILAGPSELGRDSLAGL